MFSNAVERMETFGRLTLGLQLVDDNCCGELYMYVLVGPMVQYYFDSHIYLKSCSW